MQKTLALDVDGVLLNWTKGFYDWLLTHNIEGLGDLTTDTCYAFSNTMKGLSEDQIDAYYLGFNTHDHFLKLPPIEGALEACHALRAAGFKLIAITAPGDDLRTQRMRRDQLKDFPLEDLYMLGMNASKADMLRKTRAFALVDDSPEKILEAQSVAGKAFAFDQPYNQHMMIDPMHRLMRWNTCLPKVLRWA